MNDIDPVLHRLAKADPAPSAADSPAVDTWTVLLDTISERNGKMQQTTTAPWWRRGPAIATAVFALMIGAVALVLSVTTTDSTEVAEPSPTTQPAATTQAPAMPGPGEPWDMVVIAHGRLLGESIPQMYAESAEQALGVEVNLHLNDGIHANPRRVLEHIRGGRYPDLSDQIRQAEIILLQTRPINSGEDGDIAIDADVALCSEFLPVTDPQPPAPTSTEYWQPYRDLLDTLYTEIWALRDGAPTVLIAVDNLNPYLAEQQRAGIEAECAAWYEAWSSLDAEVAADHGATMVSAYDIFNGPGHDIDPVAMGYVGPSEEIPALLWYTPNEVGGALVADALAAVGFEPRPMP